jgi:hypothetical protein
MVDKEVVRIIPFCLFLFWKKNIFTKLLAATNEIKNIRIMLSLTEKIFTTPSAPVPANVGTIYVMDAHTAVNSSQSD